jgi:hypothetical protein
MPVLSMVTRIASSREGAPLRHQRQPVVTFSVIPKGLPSKAWTSVHYLQATYSARLNVPS